MDYKFVDSSEAAIEKDKIRRGGFQRKYPWDECPMGKSFTVDYFDNDSKERQFLSIRESARQAGKKRKCRFVVIQHEECIEVARRPLANINIAESSEASAQVKPRYGEWEKEERKPMFFDKPDAKADAAEQQIKQSSPWGKE